MNKHEMMKPVDLTDRRQGPPTREHWEALRRDERIRAFAQKACRDLLAKTQREKGEA